jgi:hypothetical protein
VDSARQKAGNQRVRIGLTGLASVFLAVLLAAVFTGRTHEESPIAPNGMVPTGPGAAARPPPAQSPPEEPLATLGLTPSNPDSNAAAAPAPNGPPAGRR